MLEFLVRLVGAVLILVAVGLWAQVLILKLFSPYEAPWWTLGFATILGVLGVVLIRQSLNW